MEGYRTLYWRGEWYGLWCSRHLNRDSVHHWDTCKGNNTLWKVTEHYTGEENGADRVAVLRLNRAPVHHWDTCKGDNTLWKVTEHYTGEKTVRLLSRSDAWTVLQYITEIPAREITHYGRLQNTILERRTVRIVLLSDTWTMLQYITEIPARETTHYGRLQNTKLEGRTEWIVLRSDAWIVLQYITEIPAREIMHYGYWLYVMHE